MARVNVNPNRMELSRLKKRLAVAIRGHKLLKDKQDALIKAFLEKARAVKAAREKVENELVSCYHGFLMARAQTLPAMLEEALMISGSTCTLDVKTRNVMSVIVPEYEVHQEGSTFNYGMATTPASLDVALEDFSKVIPSLLQLAADEKAVALMSTEIERTPSCQRAGARHDPQLCRDHQIHLDEAGRAGPLHHEPADESQGDRQQALSGENHAA